MKMEFTKMHGTGNDYVYVNCMEQELPNPGAISEYISHRRFGIGSDGLIMICKSDVADFKMRIFNADASEAKMCGNGSRCIAKYVYDKGLTDKTTFTLETLSGIKTIDVFLGEDGKVAEASIDQGLVLEEDVVYNGTAISVGNPHFVTFVDDVDALDLEKLGPKFEKHKLFPENVNTEFVQVIDKNTVKFRVWERGSGETWACGTGATAVCVATIMLGHAGKKGEELTVIAKGGTLKLTHLANNHVILRGPAVTVFEGVIDIPDEVINK